MPNSSICCINNSVYTVPTIAIVAYSPPRSNIKGNLREMDKETTVADLREIVRQFVSERDWQQFHAPKNLSMALSIEASELMEHFQWLTVEDSRAIHRDAEVISEVADEMSDVACYLLAMANELEIDLSEAIHKKMKKNIEKYPASEFNGRYKK